MPSMANKIFLVPKPAEGEMIDLGLSLIVEREKFDFSGSTCNKIGVGYSAFQTQGQRCGQPIGSCLENQIYHLMKEDQLLLQKGLKPKYHYLGTFPNKDLDMI